MAFDIDNVRKDINNLVVITDGKKDNRVIGITQQGITNSVNANYSSPLVGQLQESLSNFMKQASVALNQLNYRSIPQANVVNARQTVQIWTNTDDTSFSVSMLFLAIREGEDVVEEIMKLLRYVYPQWSANGKEIKAPNEYTVTSAKGSRFGVTAKGTVSISVGQMFFAPQQIITSVSYEFSQRVLPNGRPMWATAQVTFRPFRVVDYKDVKGYFKTDLPRLRTVIPDGLSGFNTDNRS
jgi:hypothetical protein